MSRTYRKKKVKTPEWVYRIYKTADKKMFIKDCEPGFATDFFGSPVCKLRKDSNEGIRRNRKFHSDKSNNFKEPGPSWFKNLCTIRPERRRTKRELNKFFNNTEYEVQLYSKYFYKYWT